MTTPDRQMFPPIFSGQELSPKLKLWSMLTLFRDGACPQDLAEEALHWGIARGEPVAVAKRIGELLDEMVERRTHRRVDRLAGGRFRAILVA